MINIELPYYNLFLVQKDYSNYVNLDNIHFYLEGDEYQILVEGQHTIAPNCLAWWEEE